MRYPTHMFPSRGSPLVTSRVFADSIESLLRTCILSCTPLKYGFLAPAFRKAFAGSDDVHVRNFSGVQLKYVTHLSLIGLIGPDKVFGTNWSQCL